MYVVRTPVHTLNGENLDTRPCDKDNGLKIPPLLVIKIGIGMACFPGRDDNRKLTCDKTAMFKKKISKTILDM